MGKGILVVNARGHVRIKFTNANNKSVEMAVPDAELSRELKDEMKANKPQSLNGREVELNEVGGQPKSVRTVGQPFRGATAPPQHGAHVPGPAQAHQPPPPPGPRSDFVNPYNFVRAVHRDGLPPDSELRDRSATGHDRFHEKHLSGTIRVALTTETPLLIPDAAHANENVAGHKTYPVRLGPDGKPYLAPTAVKGMLRAAYEAITNSRLGVFPGSLPTPEREATANGARLAMRMPAEDGLALIPARIENGAITLLMGTTNGFPTRAPNSGRWQIPGSLQYAAWLERYLGPALCYLDDGSQPQHGDTVHCWIQKIQHWRFNRSSGQYVRDFQFWGVREIARDPKKLKRAAGVASAPPANPTPGGPQPRKSAYQPLSDVLETKGWVNISNQNIRGKHDERVFFGTASQAVVKPLTFDLVNAWSELIRDYQAIHVKDLEQREKHKPKEDPWEYLGHEPGRTAWSRHVYTRGYDRLSDGTLCYAFVDPTTQEVRALYPVMIARKLFPKSPLESLDPSLRPAIEATKLSPADRVFGWVHQNGSGAHRGQLRVGPVTMTSPESGWLRKFEHGGLPLAILGEPKPQQVRFYLGDPDGKSQRPRLTKEDAGYDGRKQLRGRKVYPHHRVLPNDHWTSPGANSQTPSEQGTFHEYLRSNDERDKQNRSVLGWVNPGTTFAFDLHVTNLSEVELGALVWLLTLPDGHFHRLGLGKPLGFGSVRLRLAPGAQHTVQGTDGWKRYYATLDETPPEVIDLEATRSAFETELRRAYPTEADRILNAFKVAAAGVPNLPVHYPRAGQAGQPVAPNPRGEGYEWFVANDAGPRLTLPDLTSGDPGLPALPPRG